MRDDPVQHALEVLAEQLVCLVQHQHLALTHVCDLADLLLFLASQIKFIEFVTSSPPHLLLHEVEYPAGCGHHQVNLLVDPHDVVFQVGAAYDKDILLSSRQGNKAFNIGGCSDKIKD